MVYFLDMLILPYCSSVMALYDLLAGLAPGETSLPTPPCPPLTLPFSYFDPCVPLQAAL